MSGFGVDRLAKRVLAEARALEVPTLPDEDAVTPTPVELARSCGIEPDGWQRRVLESEHKRVLLCCSRQSGKSTTTALAAVHEAAYFAGSLILLVSPSQRQSGELARTVMQLYGASTLPLPEIHQESALRMELDNHSRIIALPGSESTTRGYAGATLVILDEAARVVDDLLAAVRPTLATTNGRLIALTTPAGKRGWFYEAWAKGGDSWERTLIKAQDCPRISAEWLAEERHIMGEFKYQQEYLCEFLDAETSVFASDIIERAFSKTLKPLWPVAA